MATCFKRARIPTFLSMEKCLHPPSLLHATFCSSTTKQEQPIKAPPSRLTEMFKHKKGAQRNTHNIYLHSQNILSILTTMDNRCRNAESENPVLAHDYLSPAILSKFVPHIYKHKEVLGRFGGIGSHIEPYRTLFIDQLLREFVFNGTSDKYHVIELGVGFDFRMERILGFMENTDQQIESIDLNLYELDLPNVVDVRQCLMEELGDAESGNFCESHSKINVQRKALRKSIFDIKWIQTLSEEIAANNGDRRDFGNVMIVTEALFWIISENEKENVIRRLSKHFKGATLVFDTRPNAQFMKENEGKMFETEIQCSLLNQDQIRNNVPFKFNEWELKGVPLRVEVGARDIETNSCMIARRDEREEKGEALKKVSVKIDGKFVGAVKKLLDDIHTNLYNKAVQKRDANMATVTEWDAFLKEVQGGKIVFAPHCNDNTCEDLISKETREFFANQPDLSGVGISGKAKALCIPVEQIAGDRYDLNAKPTQCFHCKQKAAKWIMFGRSY